MPLPAFTSADFQEMHESVREFLFQLTAIPSVSNEELEACEYTYEAFSKIPGLIVEK